MEIDSIEAKRLVDGGLAIVKSGGFTLFKGHYCSYGTIPECYRGGSVSTMHREDWQVITIRQHILRTGFYPCPWRLPVLRELQQTSNDTSVDVDDLVRYVKSLPEHKKDFKNNTVKGNQLWQDYFNHR